MAPFKSSLSRSAGKLFGVFREQDLSLRGATQSTRFNAPGAVSATGGTTSTPGDGYKYHVFTSPATTPQAHTFSITSGSRDLNVLVVGGGGGGGGKYGGSAAGGGGGAGAVHDRLLPGINPGTYPITVGAGGLGNTYPDTSAGNPGDNTVWNAPGTSTPALTAAGGGAGGGGPAPHHEGLPGGSGGGNAYTDPNGNNRSTGSGDPYPGSGPTISPSNGWGNNGGIADPGSPRAASGGGGAGAVGDDGPNLGGGVGMEISWVLPTHGDTKFFAGGGGGGNADGAPNANLPNPGPGGGGSGGAYAYNTLKLPANARLQVVVGEGGKAYNTRGSSNGFDSYVKVLKADYDPKYREGRQIKKNGVKYTGPILATYTKKGPLAPYISPFLVSGRYATEEVQGKQWDFAWDGIEFEYDGRYIISRF